MVAPPMHLLHLLILVAATYGGSIPESHKANETGVPHEPGATQPSPPHPQPIAAPGSKPILPSGAVDSGITCTNDADCNTTQMGPHWKCNGTHCAHNDNSSPPTTTGKSHRGGAVDGGITCTNDADCNTTQMGPHWKCNGTHCAHNDNSSPPTTTGKSHRDDGNGGADSIQPMAITFVTILLAKLFTL